MDRVAKLKWVMILGLPICSAGPALADTVLAPPYQAIEPAEPGEHYADSAFGSPPATIELGVTPHYASRAAKDIDEISDEDVSEDQVAHAAPVRAPAGLVFSGDSAGSSDSPGGADSAETKTSADGELPIHELPLKELPTHDLLSQRNPSQAEPPEQPVQHDVKIAGKKKAFEDTSLVVSQAAAVSTEQAALVRKGVQEVSVIAGDLGFFPKTIFVTRDVPVRLFVTGASKNTLCIMMDSFQVRKQIRSQKIEEITFTPSTPGKYRYYCPVNGMEGTMIVKELTTTIAAEGASPALEKRKPAGE